MESKGTAEVVADDEEEEVNWRAGKFGQAKPAQSEATLDSQIKITEVKQGGGKKKKKKNAQVVSEAPTAEEAKPEPQPQKPNPPKQS
mmetsp:Transcript_4526/g.7711  ORF Transcript_4526/g.7711 Transcript_4526/m.7711 type:complete len:87 (+) Transcript_4526:1874-2134(+)